MFSPSKDAIYAKPMTKVADFRFDHSVAEVFPDMIQRSVPGYETIVDGIGQLSQHYAQANSHIYDLGCALGAVSQSIRHYCKTENCKIIAVDNSEAMVERCQRYLDAYRSTITYQILHQDVCDTPIENASMIVMNFTLQFIAKQKRDALIAKLYKDMLPEGILVISEKISHPTESGNQLLENLHHEFKRRNGYSELEISQKRSALESIMQTESLDTHRKRLFDAGFKDVILWFNCFNFCSMVAVK